MNYTVRYLSEAEQELAALGVDSAKREAVTKAVHRELLFFCAGTKHFQLLLSVV